MTAGDAATEVVADVAEEVAEQALHVANASRGANGRGVGLAVGAFFLGAGIGGGVVYILAKRALETKYQNIAAEAEEEMRVHYTQKMVALEAEAAKRPVSEIVEARGYSSPDKDTSKPPMAVSPPQKVVDDAKEEAKETLKDARPDGAKVVKEPQEHAEVQNVFEKHGDPSGDVWVQAEEVKRRSPDIPYVIHLDERDEYEDYQPVSLTYFEGDDVLSNERDDVIGPEDRERLVGEKNLEKFGHGSQDPNIVYIRNDELELVYEVVKSPRSYAEEVAGFRHEGFGRGNLERMRSREREQHSDDD